MLTILSPTNLSTHTHGNQRIILIITTDAEFGCNLFEGEKRQKLQQKHFHYNSKWKKCWPLKEANKVLLYLPISAYTFVYGLGEYFKWTSIEIWSVHQKLHENLLRIKVHWYPFVHFKKGVLIPWNAIQIDQGNV